jgi:hypothetical protein
MICMRDFQANCDCGVPSERIPDTIANALIGRYDLAPQLATVSYTSQLCINCVYDNYH